MRAKQSPSPPVGTFSRSLTSILRTRCVYEGERVRNLEKSSVADCTTSAFIRGGAFTKDFTVT